MSTTTIRKEKAARPSRAARRTVAEQVASEEPLGIVISSGERGDASPRFLAYVWGPVPDADAELTAVA